MLVCLLLIAIAAGWGVPTFGTVSRNAAQTTRVNLFIQAVYLARSEAIKRNANVVVCRAASAAGCATSGDWQQGWIVFSDDGAGAHRNNGVLDADETMLRYQQPLTADYHLTGNANSISFLASGGVQITGGGAPPITLTLCRAAPTAGRQERVIVLSTTGRSSVTKTVTGTCP
jgi:type IV fimbrial biogenesis protein FimT